jgi:isopenicillin N synthase-like dioxygenase
MSQQTKATIPVIDLEPISIRHASDEIDRDTLAEKGNEMKNALQTYGFFYAKNHGITANLIDNVLASAKSFFEKDEQSKMRHFRGAKGELGWIRMESEKSDPDSPGDLKESFNYHPTDDRNIFLQSDFNQNCKSMYLLCSKLTYNVTDALSIALGSGHRILREAYQQLGLKGNQTLFRSLMYPPIPPNHDVKPGQIRLGEHTDYGMVTFLFQDDAGGLEMNTPNLGYIPVTPISETIVVFVGLQMQIITGDALVAPKHKILFPVSEAEARKRRQSATFALRADDNFVLKSLDGSQKYKPVYSSEYLDHRQTEVIV